MVLHGLSEFAMRILLTNDDGISCDGIRILADKLSAEHEVWLVAPDRNRSAVSNAVTLFEPLCLKKVDERAYTCSGLPADCTINGVYAVMADNPPDIIISGINKGGNMGTDLVYSGTAAAARQAAVMGFPSMAVSLVERNDIWNYEPLADFVLKNLSNLKAMTGKGYFLNINAASTAPYKGVKFTEPAELTYNDKIELYKAPDGNLYSFFCGGKEKDDGNEKSDYTAVKQGYISVSPILVHPKSADKCEDFANFNDINLKI